jgi:hypothetical protein
VEEKRGRGGEVNSSHKEPQRAPRKAWALLAERKGKRQEMVNIDVAEKAAPAGFSGGKLP